MSSLALASLLLFRCPWHSSFHALPPAVMLLSHAPPHSPLSPVGRCGGAQTLLAAIQASAASIDVGRHMIRQFATCSCCVRPPRGGGARWLNVTCPHVLRGRAARGEMASASQSSAHLHVIHAPGHQLIPDLRGAHPRRDPPGKTRAVAIRNPRTDMARKAAMLVAMVISRRYLRPPAAC